MFAHLDKIAPVQIALPRHRQKILSQPLLVLHEGFDVALEPLQRAFALSDRGPPAADLAQRQANLFRQPAGLEQQAQLIVADIEQLVPAVDRPLQHHIERGAGAWPEVAPDAVALARRLDLVGIGPDQPPALLHRVLDQHRARLFGSPLDGVARHRPLPQRQREHLVDDLR